MVNLSIFSFKETYQILIFVLIIFVSYNVYLNVETPTITMLQNQSQQNYSFAQDFIYENTAENIIVGSSMSARMKNSFFPNDFYNLSFGGGSVLTGLEIIKRSGFVPKNIYIENNVIFRERDERMLESLFYPVWWKLKDYVPALKEKYQPLNILISKIKGSYGKSHEEYMKETKDKKIFLSSIKRHKEDYNKDLESYHEKLADLRALIGYFEKKGVNIFFFEMPIDYNLAYSKKAKAQRRIIKESFENNWISLPDNGQYQTSDGIHLLYKSAYEYSNEFLVESRKIDD